MHICSQLVQFDVYSLLFFQKCLCVYNVQSFSRLAFLGRNCAYCVHVFMVIEWPQLCINCIFGYISLFIVNV